MVNDLEKLSLRKFKIKSILSDATILILGRRRSGKSLLKGEKVLMFDGSIKNVEDIKIGELVMGDDSTPRTVMETHSGTDTMYKITHTKDCSYTVNSHHILSLKCSSKKSLKHYKNKKSFCVNWFNRQESFSYNNKNKQDVYHQAKQCLNTIDHNPIIDIPIKDYLKLSKTHRDELFGYQVPIHFQEKNTPIDPYIFGYCLSNNSNIITTQNSKIIYYFANALYNYKSYLNYIGSNQYQIHPDVVNVSIDKGIPSIYKCNSRENRLKLFAGIIDSIGQVNTVNNTFEIIQTKTNEQFIDDIVYLTRSLGFSTTKEPSKISIYGKNLQDVPTISSKQVKDDKRDNLTHPIIVEEIGQGEYYGIELSSNNRFVLGNFIVTHNSWLARDIFYHHQHIPSGVVFSGTEEASPFFGDFIPDCFIHPEYDPELIENLLVKQKKKIREAKLQGKSDTGKLPSNNIFIVLDDMLHDAQNWKKEKTIKSIFFNGRHYNILFILTMQYPLGITPELRSNIDYVFVFNEPSIKNRKKIYDDYAGMISSFDFFCNILDSCTQNHECLVIKTSSNSTDLKDQIFWYKAENHSNFYTGHPKLWKFHNSNYNIKYEEQNEKDHEKVQKLKKKFANTKKLKVLVNKDGDIIDVNPGSE